MIIPESTIVEDVSSAAEESTVGWVRKLFSGFILFDVALLGIPILMLVPLFRLARLPLRINPVEIAGAFFGGTCVPGAFTTIVLLLMTFPPHQTVGPLLTRFREKKALILMVIVFLVLLSVLLGFTMGCAVSFASLGVAELLERRKRGFQASLLDIIVPACFLLIGVTLAFSFNHALAGIRNPQTYDSFLDHMDALLFHANASQIAHASLRHFPLWFFKLLEMVYFSLYARLLGVLILAAVLGGRNHAMKFVRAMLVCYAIAIITYAILPAKGPYSTCTLHASSYPRSLATFATQEGLAMRAHLLWMHDVVPRVLYVVPEDYYISFPSLHVALPLIAIWAMRRWKPIALILLAVYAVLMLPSILLLEWHYVVDFFGGFGAAALSIWLTESVSSASVLGESLADFIARRTAGLSAPTSLEPSC